LEVAAEFKVRKIIYVSSVAAVSHENPPMNKSTWNDDFSNDYYKSKIALRQSANVIGNHKDGHLNNFLDGSITKKDVPQQSVQLPENWL